MSEPVSKKNKKTRSTSERREPASARGLDGNNGPRGKSNHEDELKTSAGTELERERERILKCFPPGLVKSLRNLQDRMQRIETLYYYLEDKQGVLKNFRDMKRKYDGRFLALRNIETGDIRRAPVKSRWNGAYTYSKRVWKQLMNEVKGLRATKMLTLTFDPKRVDLIMPGWWTFGDKAFLIAVGNDFINGFLKRLEDYDRRHEKPFNYIACVMEFHESGQLHYHLLFYGNWIAPLEDIQKMWPFSEPQGVDLGSKSVSGNGYSAVAYMTKYITGMMSEIAECKNEEWYAWVWFFRKRLFNTRHKRAGRNRQEKRTNPNGSYVLPSQDQPGDVKKGLWECIGHYVSETDISIFTRFKDGPEDIGLKDVQKLMTEYAAAKGM